MKKLIFLAFFLTPFSLQAKKQTVYDGSLSAKIIKIYDGDTITVDIDDLPELFGKGIGIRVYGVDTPEIRGPNKRSAIRSRNFARKLCPIGSQIELQNLRRGKYFRIVADVICNGKNLSEELIKRKLGVPYFGGKKNSK